MDLGLKGRKAIITGGTKGIGRAIAELLADEGCNVGICARNADEVRINWRFTIDRAREKLWKVYPQVQS